jgi:hypothetical protein
MASVINTFTKTGKASRVSKGSNPSPLGHFDPSTGRVYQKPRLKADDLGGSSVVVTNPAASRNGSRNLRTASLGMGNVLQRGRTRDV